MATKSAVVHSDPEILGGTPVFVGTRVPVKSLYDYLDEDISIEGLLAGRRSGEMQASLQRWLESRKTG